MKYNKNEFMGNTALTLKKQSIFEKIASFFKKIFGNNKEETSVISSQSMEINTDDKKQDFQNSIKVECDFEEERLLNLQKQFENKDITEDDISENDKIELKGLYYMQMLKSKMKIKIYKERIGKNKLQAE